MPAPSIPWCSDPQGAISRAFLAHHASLDFVDLLVIEGHEALDDKRQRVHLTPYAVGFQLSNHLHLVVDEGASASGRVMEPLAGTIMRIPP